MRHIKERNFIFMCKYRQNSYVFFIVLNIKINLKVFLKFFIKTFIFIKMRVQFYVTLLLKIIFERCILF